MAYIFTLLLPDMHRQLLTYISCQKKKLWRLQEGREAKKRSTLCMPTPLYRKGVDEAHQNDQHASSTWLYKACTRYQVPGIIAPAAPRSLRHYCPNNEAYVAYPWTTDTTDAYSLYTEQYVEHHWRLGEHQMQFNCVNVARRNGKYFVYATTNDDNKMTQWC